MAAYGPSLNWDWPEIRRPSIGPDRVMADGYRLHDQPSAPDFYRGHLSQRIRNRVIRNKYRADGQ